MLLIFTLFILLFAGGIAIAGFDSLLYEAILLSNKYGGVRIDIKENVNVGINVEDGGLLSSFLQSLVGNLKITSNIDHPIDFTQCLAEGRQPQYFLLIGKLTIHNNSKVLHEIVARWCW